MSGQHLARIPKLPRALVGLFEEGLNRHSTREDDLKQEAFLARTLGLLDSQTIVFPALQHGMKPEQDREVRKNSIASIAVIAVSRGRTQRAGQSRLRLVEDLVAATSDSDSLIRDTATYALGLIDSPESRDRLAVLLNAGECQHASTRPSRLARQKSTAGLPVFQGSPQKRRGPRAIRSARTR